MKELTLRSQAEWILHDIFRLLLAVRYKDRWIYTHPEIYIYITICMDGLSEEVLAENYVLDIS